MSYLLPDLLGVCRDYLRQEVSVDAIAGDRVHVLRMPHDPTFPLVILTQVSDLPLDANTDRYAWADIQFECYGATQADELGARTLAATVHAALKGLPGFEAEGARVSSVATVTGLQPVPDVEIDKARWIFEARVTGYTKVPA